MQIHAGTQSRAWKRGADKKIAALLKVECDLRDMCGKLHLDALNAADVALLTALYLHIFSGYGDCGGTVIVKDSSGKEVIAYTRSEQRI